ncbi:coiled-coil domain-containing protein 122 [Spea bombifrons]|uniref:coiled-coil domain-containing protein 122 n=1 Tax=Spea bombifrons TaxID=233779 RepID=UPI00234A8431|nr:coiled-coil domain-containing protein 122 [Spea bombifrons]
MADNTPSLTEVVNQVAQQQQTQASEIEKSRDVLREFQTKLYELEAELKSVLWDTKAVEKQMCYEEDTMENIMHLCGILESQNYSICAENIKLKLALETQREDFEAIVSRNTDYRKRIANKIKHFDEEENKLPVMIELIKKRNEIRILKQKKEQMMGSLHNPESTAIKQVQEEIECLRERINNLKQSIAAKHEAYEKEREIHAALRKEIEVHKKRYDAILKRLHCQLNKAQLKRRQYQWDIERMEKIAADLRERALV